MASPPSTRDRVTAHIGRFREAAERTVAELQESAGFMDEPAELAERAQASLAVAAQHELLQALTQLHLEADLFARYARSGGTAQANGEGGGVDEATLLESAERLRDTVARATAMTRIYLDPAETNRLLIRLDLAPVDLSRILESHLRAGHLLGTPNVDTVLGPAEVVGDSQKLMVVFDHLVGRFLRQRGPGQQVQVRVGTAGDETEVFIGLSQWPDGAETLIGELSAPLRLDGIGADVPYARAVIERHGGRFLIGRSDDDGAGFRLLLPRRTTTTAEVPR